MSKPVYLGIDPGLSGALAFYAPRRNRLDVYDMPTETYHRNGKVKRRVDAVELGRIIGGHAATDNIYACVELVGAMPGQGVTSMFTFGRGVGVVDGVLGALEITPIVYVPPRTWMSAVGLPPKADKSLHRKFAQKAFPGAAHLFGRVKDDGRADAALIAKYAATTGDSK